MFSQWRQHIQRVKSVAMVSVIAGLVMGPSLSHAVLTDSLGIGNAKALSLAHAVTADPPGIDSIHFNPAGLVKLKGRQRQIKVISGSFDITLELGDYNQQRKNLLEQADTFYNDANFPIELKEDYFYDESHNSTSETEGASMMMPFFGMQDLPVLLFPIGGASYSAPESNVTFGTNVYTPLAAGFYRADDDPGRFIGQRLSFMLLTYFSPSIAVQVTDEFSFGASINFNYAGVGLELPFRSPHIGIWALPGLQDGVGCEDEIDGQLVNLCGQLNPYDVIGTLSFEVEKQLAFGFNVGFLWEPTPWFAFGFVYQSPVSMAMEGDYQWVNEQGWVDFITPLANPDPNSADPLAQITKFVLAGIGIEGIPVSEGTAFLDMEMPEHYSFGVSLQLTPQFKVNVDYKFTAWSAWQGIPVEFSESIDLLALAGVIQSDMATSNSLTFPLGLEDTWNWAAGFEYAYSDRLDLRFGIEDRPSSIPEEARSPLLPIGSGLFYGLGFGYKLDSGAQWDVGLAYFSSEVEMPGGSSRLGNSNDGSLVIYNPFPGQDITATLEVILFEMSYRSEF
ncbi:hypothetical protein A9Q99_25800 [Gammaproteobacteria bacterium 45_16_T64]|nr:hypothetical protein A9Q99_25800 [Gammaproteobacteria bacterium 45_16_T64]